MSIFSETMKKTFSIYRQMLRKYLPQAERINKLQQLNLKNAQLYENDIALYRTGYAIVADIEKNLGKSVTGYYAYSGVANFATHLRSFLEGYTIEGTQVIHSSQKASRALVKAIQCLSLPREKFTADIAEELLKCNALIARYGSEKQRDLHKTALQNALSKQPEQNSSFYRSVLHNFQQRLHENNTHT